MVVTPAAVEPLCLSGGRYVVPGNRTDLMAGRWPGEPPSVSVVVPYYADQARLDLVLAGLSQQTHPPERTEVVVADDGSPQPPDLAALAPAIRRAVVRQDDLGFRAGAARNLGARAARGDVLCFLDGDTVPTPDYLRQLTRLPALLPDALVTGHRRHADLTEWRPERLVRWLTGDSGGPPELPAPQWLADLHRRTDNLARLERRSYEGVISAVLAVAAALFAEVGGFDESFTSYGGEDWEFGFRALNAGAVLAHEPAAVAWHDGPDWGARALDPVVAAAEKAREDAALARLIPGLAADGPPDVVVVEPGAAEPVGVRSARVRVTVHADDRWPDPATVQALAERVGPGQLGRARVDGPGWSAEAVSTAARARADRWGADLSSPDLLGELFDTEERTVALRAGSTT
ncbi:MAG: glycosyltransferase [Geodermatophilaceae bacterium]|nr:glycosyltransferase [Geodermatophilaceae bacterium]